MEKRIDIYGEVPENMEWKDNQAVVVHENGWFKADMTCNTKSVKVALNRFFNAVPELKSWRESMEADYECSDRMIADGTINSDMSYAWKIDCTNALDDAPNIYVFVNINEKARGGLD